MKNAINAYEQLLDAFHYVLHSWLNIKITERGNLEAKEMTAAACFLLDNLYAKEDVGAELSVLVAADLGKVYNPTHLMDKATEMLLKAAKEADNNTLSPIYLQQAGAIFVKQGKYDQAIEAYQTIKDKYFRSYQALQIGKFIEEAKLMKK